MAQDTTIVFNWDEGNSGLGFWDTNINCGRADHPGGANNSLGSRVVFGVDTQQRFPGTFSVEQFTDASFIESCLQHSTAQRAEIGSGPENYINLGVTEGTTTWLGWSEKFTEIDESHIVTVLQFRNNCGPGSPAVQINMMPGKLLQLRTREPTLRADIGYVEEGKWYDFVIEIKYSKGADGYIKVWRQEVGAEGSFCYENPTAEILNTPTMLQEDACPHIRWGIYRHQSSTKTPNQILPQDHLMVRYLGPAAIAIGDSLGEAGFEGVRPKDPQMVSSPLITGIVSTPVSDCQNMNGRIEIEALGNDLEYSIDGGLSYQISPLFSQLDSGFYQVAIRERGRQACTQVIADSLVSVELVDLPAIASVSYEDISACDTLDGWIQIEAEGENLLFSIDGGLAFKIPLYLKK